MNGDQHSTGTESYRTRGDELLSKVKQLIREGNVRRIIIRNEEGRTLVEIPLTLGVVGAALAPALAAIGAIAALVTDCTIEVQRSGERPTEGMRTEREKGPDVII